MATLYFTRIRESKTRGRWVEVSGEIFNWDLKLMCTWYELLEELVNEADTNTKFQKIFGQVHEWKSL